MVSEDEGEFKEPAAIVEPGSPQYTKVCTAGGKESTGLKRDGLGLYNLMAYGLSEVVL